MPNFDSTSIIEFSRDKRKARIHSIDEDLKLFEKAFSAVRTGLTGLVKISRLRNKGVNTPIYKARKFRCKSMGGSKGARSGVRLIFAYIEEEDRVVYIELYKKNKQKDHDENRIIKYFKK